MQSRSQVSYRSTVYWLLAAVAYLYAITVYASSAQAEFYSIAVSAGVAFCAYTYFHLERPSLPFVIVLGLLARISLLWLFPSLSDDIYRFYWDGKLTAAGYNPYSHLPSTLLESKVSIPGITQELFAELNSPEYYTIYPPISQLIFFLSSCWTDSVTSASTVMKAFFIIAEIATLTGVLRLLKHLERPSHLVGLYWLNPLVIVEGVGNLHFEILMISFLCWAFYAAFVRKQVYTSALLLSISVAVKLLPLMLLPFFFLKMPAAQRIRFFALFICSSLLFFVPIFYGLQIANFATSVDLYFQKFEFNGSTYYVLRAAGYWLSGYNLIHYIGPLLGVATVGLIFRKAIQAQKYTLDTAIGFSLYAFTAYLLLATTVHPWYLITPLFLALLTEFRFVYFWSMLIVLTYINYSYGSYYENPWVVGFEYTVVIFLLIWEALKYNESSNGIIQEPIP